jgi:hypothetical protein
MTAPSGASHLPLPRWAYVPGESQKSSADYETLAQITALVPPRFGGYVPGGDGFAVAALAALIKAKLARPQLAKADLVTFEAAGRT